jgi:hypothetical protein
MLHGFPVRGRTHNDAYQCSHVLLQVINKCKWSKIKGWNYRIHRGKSPNTQGNYSSFIALKPMITRGLRVIFGGFLGF